MKNMAVIKKLAVALTARNRVESLKHLVLR
ncbi:hypothetical protein ABH930_000486 [Kitasatospora sp. GAS204A]|nr:hypothetical protein [Kitasatospora sp. GAS204B]